MSRVHLPERRNRAEASASATPVRTPSRTTVLRMLLFFAAHVPLGFVVFRYPVVGAVHAAGATFIGVCWALGGRHPWRVACVAAYIAGAEVLWRMTGTPIFWEFGKYAVILLFLLAVPRLGWGRSSTIALAFFALLLPSAVLTIAENPLPVAINDLSFNLSGPFVLMASVLFFSRLRVTLAQFRFLLLMGAAPVLASSVIVWKGVLQATGVTFGGSSVAMSGGYTPNQVSAAFGLAVLLLGLYLLSGPSGIFFGATLLALLLVFATQSAMTFSRGGLLLTTSGLAVASLQLVRERPYRRRLFLGGGLLAAAALLFVIPRLLSYTGGAIASRFSTTSTTGRVQIVEADLDSWLQAPIFGVGPGQASENRIRFFRLEASHTEFTRLLAEHGLFGLAAIICLVALAVRAWRPPASRVSRALRCAMLTWSLVYMLIYGVRFAAPGLAFGLSLATVSEGAASPNRRRSRRKLVPMPILLRRNRLSPTSAVTR